jgi:tetratricopeptide (TPR) repeat protein
MNQDDYFNRGQASINEGDWDQAITDLTESLRLFPNNSGAYYNRGLAYSNKGDNKLAIADYTESLRINPNNDVAYHNRGVAYKLTGELNLAYADLKKAVQLNPNDDLYQENLRITENAIQNSPRGDLITAQVFAKMVEERRKQEEKGAEENRKIAEYTEKIQRNVNDGSAYLSRGMIYEDRQNYDQAIADYEMAVKIKPDDVDYCKRLDQAKATKTAKEAEIEKKERAEQRNRTIKVFVWLAVGIGAFLLLRTCMGC